jgi:hypothetical protein
MRAVVAVLLAGAWSAAFGATRLEDLVVKPNPAVAEVEISVTVNRGQFDKQSCDIFVTPEEGAAPIRMPFLIGEPRTKSIRHTYKKNGAYTVKAAASSGCTGTRSADLLVGPDGVPHANAAAVAPPQAGCPAGWYVVPESVQGARYSCRPNLPGHALRCEGGTSYFAEGGAIGCR